MLLRASSVGAVVRAAAALAIALLSSTTFTSVYSATAATRPACDIHTSGTGFRSPENLLPLQAATSEWLVASLEEIQSAYKTGMDECNAYLKTHSLPTGPPTPYYFDTRTISPVGQRNCRGTATLFSLTGMLIWPFGPYTTCDTYTHCWFGLLSCGTPTLDKIHDQTAKEIESIAHLFNVSGPLPFPKAWSMQSVHLRTRVVGPEIIVPDTRHLSLNGLDAFILQFTTTKPGSFHIEPRQLEFYPAMLLSWPSYHHGLSNAGRVFLGGNEGRCRAWVKCSIHNYNPACDEQSLIVATSLMKFVAADASDKCPDVLAVSLPLCRDTQQPGRWIRADNPLLSPHCNASYAYNLVSNATSPHLSLPMQWREASGNPCLHHEDFVEEEGSTFWFFAPYSCRYHFYTRKDVHQCLEARNIRHIHFHGDSMSRDLFEITSAYLGVPLAKEADLKQLTNVLHKHDIQFHTGSLLLSEGYTWGWNPEVMRLVERPPIADVLVINHAVSHRIDYGDIFAHQLNTTEYRYWTEERNKSVPMPRIRIFQGVRDLHGARNSWFVGNNFRQNNQILRRMYESMDFQYMDEFVLTAGRFDVRQHMDNDAWHYRGSTRQMEAVVLVNLLCNDWLQQQQQLLLQQMVTERKEKKRRKK